MDLVASDDQYMSAEAVQMKADREAQAKALKAAEHYGVLTLEYQGMSSLSSSSSSDSSSSGGSRVFAKRKPRASLKKAESNMSTMSTSSVRSRVSTARSLLLKNDLALCDFLLFYLLLSAT